MQASKSRVLLHLCMKSSRIAEEMAAAAAQFAAVWSILRPVELVDRPSPQPFTYVMVLLLAWMQACKPWSAVTAGK